MAKSWFEIRAVAGQRPEVLIYDYIGSYGVEPAAFNDALKELKGADFDLRINSPGGEVFAGNAIYTMLDRYKRRHKASITVYIDGIAASMASVIAMVGDRVVMPSNAVMMIHDPSGGVLGTAKDMREWAEVLDKLKEGMVTAYERKSGKTREDIAAIMEAETWYTAAEAVDEGFADEVEEAVDIAAYFDLDKFKNPPEGYNRGAPAAAPTEETVMTEPTTQAAPAAAPQQQQQTPAAPAPTPAAAPVAPTPDPKALGQKILAACKKHGVEELAGTLIVEGKSYEEALEAILAAKEAKGEQETVTAPAAHVPANGQQKPVDDGPKAEAIDTGAIYDRFNGRTVAA